MNLIQFFRLIEMSIFQKSITNTHYSDFHNEKMSYYNTFFYCPRIHCNDGFNISFQIHNGAYCSSENGYRTLGHTIKDVEFGYPSRDEELLKKYAEDENCLTQTVGCLPIEIAQQIVIKHGGIDWEKTVSIEQFNTFIKNKK